MSTPSSQPVTRQRRVPSGAELQSLVSALDRRANALGPAYSPEELEADPLERDALARLAFDLLGRAAWQDRNLGVKLVGLLKLEEAVEPLIGLLTERRPVSWFKRLLGGDFEQVGFLRRNAVTALGRIDVVTPGVEEGLLIALDDPYYEVRAEAVRVIARLFPGFTDPRAAVVALEGRLDDRDMDVATAAARALGRVGGPDALPRLLSMATYKYWRVRAAALQGVLALVERGLGGDREQLVDGLARFVLTATDFTPQFEIRTTYRRILDVLKTAEERQGR